MSLLHLVLVLVFFFFFCVSILLSCRLTFWVGLDHLAKNLHLGSTSLTSHPARLHNLCSCCQSSPPAALPSRVIVAAAIVIGKVEPVGFCRRGCRQTWLINDSARLPPPAIMALIQTECNTETLGVEMRMELRHNGKHKQRPPSPPQPTRCR